ncbi:MAG: cytochrome P450 [Solirubrobacteraceae bacterium]|nr:cytochrome P450 [Solirubrobacteraceae bacterium]
MGERTACVTGPEAAGMFYGSGHLTRKGALPKPILWLLQDEGSVTVLDGMPHAARKAMFLSLMTPPRLQRFDELFAEEWQRAVNAWKQKDAIVLDDAVRTVVCRTACRWAGVPLDGDAEAERRGADMMAMFDGAGAIGRRRLLAWQARRRTEAWLGGLARDVRAGDLTVDPQSAFAVVAAHRDHDGTPLSNEIVMTEMVNLIRPTVAVARYITFAALALHANPAERRLLRRATPRPSVDPAALAPETAVDDAADPVWRFVQEVRRTAPFFPLLGGRATEPLTWHGHQFRQGQRVLIDLYGTNHDPVAWPEPDRFDPDRFLGWQGDANRLIPQGAGDHASDHRCPGEWLTIATMKTAIRSLATEIDYAVASQDLELSMRRIPTRPTTGLVIRAVRDAD